jgi:hypothetical protein
LPPRAGHVNQQLSSGLSQLAAHKQTPRVSLSALLTFFFFSCSTGVTSRDFHLTLLSTPQSFLNPIRRLNPAATLSYLVAPLQQPPPTPFIRQTTARRRFLSSAIYAHPHVTVSAHPTNDDTSRRPRQQLAVVITRGPERRAPCDPGWLEEGSRQRCAQEREFVGGGGSPRRRPQPRHTHADGRTCAEQQAGSRSFGSGRGVQRCTEVVEGGKKKSPTASGNKLPPPIQHRHSITSQHHHSCRRRTTPSIEHKATYPPSHESSP